MHIFTFVQVCALAMLWAVKSSTISLAFPFFLIMMIPIRQQMERLFTPLELRAVSWMNFVFFEVFLTTFFVTQLDGTQAPENTEDEPDFYEQAPLPA